MVGLQSFGIVVTDYKTQSEILVNSFLLYLQKKPDHMLFENYIR